MNSNSGPLTKEAMELSPLIDAALPASGENTNLIIRLRDFFDKVEKLELSLNDAMHLIVRCKLSMAKGAPPMSTETYNNIIRELEIFTRRDS